MSKVQHAVDHAFDQFAREVDRLILEGYLDADEVSRDLIQHGQLDFADMWATYSSGDERRPVGIEHAYREAGMSWDDIDAKLSEQDCS